MNDHLPDLFALPDDTPGLNDIRKTIVEHQLLEDVDGGPLGVEEYRFPWRMRIIDSEDLKRAQQKLRSESPDSAEDPGR